MPTLFWKIIKCKKSLASRQNAPGGSPPGSARSGEVGVAHCAAGHVVGGSVRGVQLVCAHPGTGSTHFLHGRHSSPAARAGSGLSCAAGPSEVVRHQRRQPVQDAVHQRGACCCCSGATLRSGASCGTSECWVHQHDSEDRPEVQWHSG